MSNKNKTETISTKGKETETDLKQVASNNELFERNKNDKRYHTPFEDEGACDDDFID